METVDALRAPAVIDNGAVPTTHAAPVLATPANAACGMCGGSGSLSAGWVAKRRGWIIAGAAAVAGTGVALGEGWLSVSALAPLLYAAPCAIMMVFCMKGMSRGMQVQGQTQNQAVSPPPSAGADAPRAVPELEKQA